MNLKLYPGYINMELEFLLGTTNPPSLSFEHDSRARTVVVPTAMTRFELLFAL